MIDMNRRKVFIALFIWIPIILLGFQYIVRSNLGVRRNNDVFDNLDYDEQQIWRNVMNTECLVTNDLKLNNNTR